MESVARGKCTASFVPTGRPSVSWWLQWNTGRWLVPFINLGLQIPVVNLVFFCTETGQPVFQDCMTRWRGRAAQKGMSKLIIGSLVSRLEVRV